VDANDWRLLMPHSPEGWLVLIVLVLLALFLLKAVLAR